MLAEYELESKGVQTEEASETRSTSKARSQAKNRGRLDTVAEIVNACNGGANKSRVMLVANVNSVVATELLNRLVNSGLISCTKEDNGVIYRATEAGFGFVNKYSDLVSMLCPGTVVQTRLAEMVKAASWT
jgi:predicted transcriptional regulator